MIKQLKTGLAALLLSASAQTFAEPPPVQEPSSPEAIKGR